MNWTRCADNSDEVEVEAMQRDERGNPLPVRFRARVEHCRQYSSYSLSTTIDIGEGQHAMSLVASDFKTAPACLHFSTRHAAKRRGEQALQVYVAPGR